MKKITQLHFKIDGNWFTWLLRHLWIEGNEVKAVRMWNAAFPDYVSPNYIKGLFLDVVSGKRKFSGCNDFQLVADGSKYWSTSADGEPDKNFPLLSSWEHVVCL